MQCDFHIWTQLANQNHISTFNYLKSHTISLNSTTQLCPRCSIFSETQHHIWSCAHTVPSFPDLCRSTAELISTRLLFPQWSILRKPENQLSISTESLTNFLTDTNALEFLTSPLAQGLITKNQQETLQSKFLPTQLVKQTWIHLLLDCWLSSFYNTIWLYRNSLIVFTEAHRPPQPQETPPPAPPPLEPPPPEQPPPEQPPTEQTPAEPPLAPPQSLKRTPPSPPQLPPTSSSYKRLRTSMKHS
jgi:hypothetical protein